MVTAQTKDELRERRWRNLRLLVEIVRFGDIEQLIIQDGMPIMVKRTSGTIKLDDEREIRMALALR